MIGTTWSKPAETYTTIAPAFHMKSNRSAGGARKSDPTAGRFAPIARRSKTIGRMETLSN